MTSRIRAILIAASIIAFSILVSVLITPANAGSDRGREVSIGELVEAIETVTFGDGQVPRRVIGYVLDSTRDDRADFGCATDENGAVLNPEGRDDDIDRIGASRWGTKRANVSKATWRWIVTNRREWAGKMGFCYPFGLTEWTVMPPRPTFDDEMSLSYNDDRVGTITLIKRAIEAHPDYVG